MTPRATRQLAAALAFGLASCASLPTRDPMDTDLPLNLLFQA